MDIDRIAAAAAGRTVLVVGDVMLDEFVYGEVARVSPEAPVGVIAVKRSESNVGGAGNVARNVAALGAKCLFVGVVGDDQAARDIHEGLSKDPLVSPMLVTDAGRPTTRKMRFVSEHHSAHLLRADWEVASPVGADTEQKIIAKIVEALAQTDIVLLSDYAKGVLTPAVVAAAIKAAAAADARIKVIVDPKHADFAYYLGASLLTPNLKELSATAHRALKEPGEIVTAARSAMAAACSEAMLVTMSENGMMLVTSDEEIAVPAYPVKVRDVSGAGDTVVAAMAVMLAAGVGYADALHLANAAAAVSVCKRGTATVSMAELRRQILPQAVLAAEDKIADNAHHLLERVSDWKKQGLRVGFTNGCFDILHPGHVKVLTAARAACDRLVLGLNSDASIRRLKGEGRPVQHERARAEVLAALEAVDMVAIFEEDTPTGLIEAVRPSVIVKGGDYAPEQVVGHELVTSYGGSVLIVDITEGHSTTGLVARARSGSGSRERR